MSGQEERAPGLFGSVRALYATFVAILRTRIELFGTELQEEIARLVLALLYSFAAMLCAALGIAFVGVAVMIAAWDDHRLAAAISVALVFLALGAIGAWGVRRLLFAKLRIFDATLTELERDYARLKGKSASEQSDKVNESHAEGTR